MKELDAWLRAHYLVTFTFKSFRQDAKVVVRTQAYNDKHAVALATLEGDPAGGIDTDYILVDVDVERIWE